MFRQISSRRLPAPIPLPPNPKLVELVNCKNVKIKDITLKKAPSWTVHPWGCDCVLIDGITIDNDVVAGAWTDGIDPDCSRNVHIDQLSYRRR